MMTADEWDSPEIDLAAVRRQRRMFHTALFLMLLMFAINSKQSTKRQEVSKFHGEKGDIDNPKNLPFYKNLGEKDLNDFMDVLHETQTYGDVEMSKGGQSWNTPVDVKRQSPTTVKSRSWNSWNITGVYTGKWSNMSEHASLKHPIGVHDSNDLLPSIKRDKGRQAILDVKEQQFIQETNEEVSVFWGRLLLASGYLPPRATVRGIGSDRKDIVLLIQGLIFHKSNRVNAIGGMSASQVKVVWNQNAVNTEVNPKDARSHKLVEEGPDNKIAEEEQNGMSPPPGATMEHIPVTVWPASAEMPKDYSSGISLGIIGGDAAKHWLDLPDPWRLFAKNQNGKECAFLLNLQDSVVTSSKMRNPTAWTQILDGELSCINCDFTSAIEVKKLRVDFVSLYPKTINYCVITTMICMLQIYFIVKQLNHSQTQAAALRISLLCISLQAVLDAFLCIGHLIALFWHPLLFFFSSVAFLKLIIFCIFEMRLIMMVAQAHFPQSFVDGGVLARRQMASMHARLYAALIIILMLLWYMPSVIPVVLMGFYSFWIPQITWNAIQDTRGALRPTYMWGMSSTRLFLPAYYYSCPNSIVRSIGFINFSVEVGWWRTIVLVLWMGTQIMVMTLQDKYGPRFFIPKQFLPTKYDYHRPIPSSLMGATASVCEEGMQLISRRDRMGSSTELSEGGGSRGDLEAGISLECSICFTEVEPTRQNYMITPCHHVYHPHCLVRSNGALTGCVYIEQCHTREIDKKK